MTFLGVDVGGTSTRLAIFEEQGGRLVASHVRRFDSRSRSGLEEIIDDYLRGHDTASLTAVGIGVAGPVVQGRAQVTNLPWVVDSHALAKRLGKPVVLVNDLVAHAYGTFDLAPEACRVLQEGKRQAGNQALIACGTGLGQAILFQEGARRIPSPSEGGHTDFAPGAEEDCELWRHLRSRGLEHVSWERVVSGSDGFRNLLDLHVTRLPEGSEAKARWSRELAGNEDVGPALTSAAEDGDPLAVAVLRQFVRLYGAETGNLALKAMALGGVFVGGGVTPKILRWIEEGGFLEAFLAKGRFRGLLESMLVVVVMDEELGLRGAARAALQSVGA